MAANDQMTIRMPRRGTVFVTGKSTFFEIAFETPQFVVVSNLQYILFRYFFPFFSWLEVSTAHSPGRPGGFPFQYIFQSKLMGTAVFRSKRSS